MNAKRRIIESTMLKSSAQSCSDIPAFMPPARPRRRWNRYAQAFAENCLQARRLSRCRAIFNGIPPPACQTREGVSHRRLHRNVPAKSASAFNQKNGRALPVRWITSGFSPYARYPALAKSVPESAPWLAEVLSSPAG